MIDELANQEKVDGMVVMPLHNDLITFKINELIEQRGMPIITVEHRPARQPPPVLHRAG